MTAAAVQATALTKSYKQASQTVPAVFDLDVTLSPGELLAVTGPSGTGKTTLINLLCGWEQPDSGTITWNGASGKPPGWDGLAVVPQALALADELTVAENITFPLRLMRADVSSAGFDELVARLGLARMLDRSVTQISVGERQRVMIARGLIAQPTIVLADEPTAHQDDKNAEIIQLLLRSAVDRGAACIVASRQPTVRDAHRQLELHPPNRP
jgi:putative ABC transport system ATP-binding protein